MENPDPADLVGWKDIAAHLDVDPKTARRWEKELNLPVRRGPSGRVTASRAELDLWKSARPAPDQPPPSPAPRFPTTHLWTALAVLAASLALLWIIQRALSHTAPPSLAMVPPPRLFWHTTSEPPQPLFQLPFAPHHFALSPSQDRLFAFTYDSAQALVIDTRSLTVNSLPLPLPVQTTHRTPDGRILLIAGSTGGFFLFDLATGKPAGPPVQTDGVVSDLAATASLSKVFLAMRSRGLQRWDRASGRIDVITPQRAPTFLGIDLASNRLFVSYQGGGPRGRRGHDSVEVFDLDSERSLGFFQDLPLVGGAFRFSTLNWMVLDGWDACRNPIYDRAGCPSTPSNVLHVFRLPDLTPLRTLGFPVDAGVQDFIPSTNALYGRGPGRGDAMHNRGLTVFDLASYRFFESIRSAQPIGPITVSSDRRFAYAADDAKGFYVFPSEPPGCGYRPSYTSHFLPGDGVSTDIFGSGELGNNGAWNFSPGFIGQSFGFSRRASSPYSVWGRSFGPIDSGFAAYIKPATLGANQVFAELTHPPTPDEFWTFAITPSCFIQLRYGSAGRPPVTLQSQRPLAAGQWTFVAATRDASGLTLFRNGLPEASAPPSALGPFANSAPFTLGGRPEAFFDGSIDELAIFSRAPSPAEILRLYQSRLEGPCKP